MSRRLLFLVAVLLVVGCGQPSASAPGAGDPLKTDQGGDPSRPVPGPGAGAGRSEHASSAEAPGQLAQLLTAPRPLPPVLPAVPALQVPSGPPYKTGPSPGSPVVFPPPALPSGDGTVYAVGDSVLLGTKSYLSTTLGGWDLRFDARVGRTFPEGIDIVDENRSSVGQAAIICLGHNYWGGGTVYGYLDQLMGPLRRAQRVVVTTVAEWSPAQREVNVAIRALPRSYPNVVVADWQAVVAANPQFLISDGVHLTPGGDVALANLLAVMLGPAHPNGKIVPPPHILEIPADSEAPPTTPTTAPPPTVPTTVPPSSSTTTTTTTAPTTTTTAPTTTSTTEPTTTTSSTPPMTATTSRGP